MPPPIEPAEVVVNQPPRILPSPLREMPEQYLRGRPKGEVIEVFKHAFLEKNVSPTQITAATSELDALKLGLAWAKPGDFVIHLVHMERQAIKDYFATRNIAY